LIAFAASELEVSAPGTSAVLPLSGEGGNNLVLAEGVEVPSVERPLADIRIRYAPMNAKSGF
jgi:hypothetical protein